jgi:hypothetical protein
VISPHGQRSPLPPRSGGEGSGGSPAKIGAGRICPADYRYPVAALNRAPDFSANILYVVGGLYGNFAALGEIERLAARERGPVTIVFNGDYHWFDAEPHWFAEIERGVARHRTIRGNVETEIARTSDIGAGCGCAYPEDVEEGVVTRSNEILAELRAVAAPEATQRLAALPMHLIAAIGGVRVGIVHGDATSLAGWRFAHDALDDPENAAWLADVRDTSGIDVFASTHTCLAALREFASPGRLTIINNGAAGMANFSGTRFGLISRIAIRPSPHPALYGVARDGVFIDAIAVEYDVAAFLGRFETCWPEGSPAHVSYHRRMVGGPAYSIEQASGRARFA